MQSKDEVSMGCEKLQQTIDACSHFKEVYFDYKSKSKGEWRFPPNSLFIRLDSFIERCYDILNISSTIEQFNKLELICVGGTKGKILTQMIKTLFDEFQSLSQVFFNLSYNIINIEDKSFEDDYFTYKENIRDLENKMVSIINQSFED